MGDLNASCHHFLSSSVPPHHTCSGGWHWRATAPLASHYLPLFTDDVQACDQAAAGVKRCTHHSCCCPAYMHLQAAFQGAFKCSGARITHAVVRRDEAVLHLHAAFQGAFKCSGARITHAVVRRDEAVLHLHAAQEAAHSPLHGGRHQPLAVVQPRGERGREGGWGDRGCRMERGGPDAMLEPTLPLMQTPSTPHCQNHQGTH